MAKRRNLKKEKAQRNQAYARKFRKSKRNTGRFSKNRRYGSKPPKSEETATENNEDNFQGGTGGGGGAM